MIQFSRVLRAVGQLKTSAYNDLCKRTLGGLPKQHIYKKTWKEEELLEHLRKNVVYETDKYFVTSLPQGIGIKQNTKWWDTECRLVSDVTLNYLSRQLRLDFPTNYCFVVTYPRRCGSGLTFFAKSYEAKKYLRQNLTHSAFKGTLVFSFLALVMGRPSQTVTQEFAVKLIETKEGYRTEIRDMSLACKKCKRVNYHHEVLDSVEEFSLLKVEVSSDYHDCVRHILAYKCLTPVFGDFWHCKRRQGFMFGVPLVRDPNIKITEPFELNPEVLEKLQLEPGEEKFIPSHLHLYSVRIPLKKNSELFTSVPPVEDFVWTCNQLGLHEIEKFLQPKMEMKEMAAA